MAGTRILDGHRCRMCWQHAEYLYRKCGMLTTLLLGQVMRLQEAKPKLLGDAHRLTNRLIIRRPLSPLLIVHEHVRGA
jgi:hypothetical protein